MIFDSGSNGVALSQVPNMSKHVGAGLGKWFCQWCTCHSSSECVHKGSHSVTQAKSGVLTGAHTPKRNGELFT